eukprot:1709836-Lingulodinium_polyedra.AAC.1
MESLGARLAYNRFLLCNCQIVLNGIGQIEKREIFADETDFSGSTYQEQAGSGNQPLHQNLATRG